MTENIYHTVDAGHIRNIGEQSISNKIQAILELVKNAYDADSPDCVITFVGSRDHPNKRASVKSIIIEDHGIGMTKQDITDKLMKVGTGHKRKSLESPKLKRRVSGEKGMGHYSAQRLGDRITIFTTPEQFEGRDFSQNDNTTYCLELDWSLYESGQNFEKIPNKLSTKPRQQYGTRIEISSLRDTWIVEGPHNDLDILAKNLGSIILPKELQNKQSEEFTPSIKTRGFDISLPELGGTLLDHAVYKIQANLKKDRITFKIFTRDTNKSNVNITKPAPLTHTNVPKCGDARMVLYWFPGRVSEWGEKVINRQMLQNQLKQNCGIKIYKDGVRVMPYGEIDNDWMGLGSRKAGPQSGGKMRNVHVVGFVELSRHNNPEIMETTTREALRENTAFQSLKNDFVLRVIEELEAIARRIKEDIKENDPKTYHYNKATININRLKKNIEEINILPATQKQDVTKELNSILVQISLQKAESEKREDELVSNIEMYRNLSTVGIQTLAFNHEIIGPLSWVKGSLALLIKPDNKMPLQKRMQYLESCYDQMDNSLKWSKYIKEFASLLSGSDTVTKKRSSFRAEQLIEKIRTEMAVIFTPLQITMNAPILTNEIPTLFMNQASFESIFINLISNSVRSLKRVNRPREIHVKISKDTKNLIFEFEDNGYGMDPDDQTRVFRPFFTTHTNLEDHGTGMGLTIVKEIVEDEYKGMIKIQESIYEKTHPGQGMAKFLLTLPLDGVTDVD